jgi:hypothetical protein
MRGQTKQVYTLSAVSRPTADGWAFLVVRATWHMSQDVFSYEIPGELNREWHRRGTPVFDTWSEGVAYVRAHGWPVG